MNVSKCVARQIVLFVGIAALAGCAGSRTTTGLPSAIPQTVVPAVAAHNSAKRGALLYISDLDASKVFVYSYPSLAPVRMLSGISLPAGMCVEPKTGNVWIAERDGYTSWVAEFRHGGTKSIRTLQIGSEDEANACAVNPTNGDVAVANSTFGGDDPGDVVIFDALTSKPRTYFDKGMFFYEFLGYDPNGNLFVDGTPFADYSDFRLDQLPSGAKHLVNIRWRGPQIAYPGNIQYDGTNMTVGDMRKSFIYRIVGGKSVGSTLLEDDCLVNQYFIDSDKVIVPGYCDGASFVSIYNYPAGGFPIETITGFKFAFGAVIGR